MRVRGMACIMKIRGREVLGSDWILFWWEGIYVIDSLWRKKIRDFEPGEGKRIKCGCFGTGGTINGAHFCL